MHQPIPPCTQHHFRTSVAKDRSRMTGIRRAILRHHVKPIANEIGDMTLGNGAGSQTSLSPRRLGLASHCYPPGHLPCRPRHVGAFGSTRILQTGCSDKATPSVAISPRSSPRNRFLKRRATAAAFRNATVSYLCSASGLSDDLALSHNLNPYQHFGHPAPHDLAA